MSEKKIDSSFEFEKIAKERMRWALRPLYTTFLSAWIFIPATGKAANLDQNVLLAFILGAGLGIIIYWDLLFFYLVTRRKDTKFVPNRMPDEYYFGRVIGVLQEEGE